MGFFNKKKDSSLRPLSEDEIQKRLYGNLKPANKLSDSVPHKFKTIPTPEVPASVYTPAPKNSNYTSPDKNDLFSTPAPSPYYSDSVDKQEPAQTQDDVTPEEKTQEESIMARLGEMAEKEKSVKTPYIPLHAPAKPAAAKPAPKPTLGGASKVKAEKKPKVRKSIPIGAILKTVGGVVVGAFAAAFGIVRLINFRSAKMRTALYWILGAGILIALFFGVHLLNVQREAAMKSPVKKKAPVAEVKKVPVAAAAESREAAGQQTVVEPVRTERIETAVPAAVPTSAAENATAVNAAESGAESIASVAAEEGRYVVQVATYAGPNDANRVREQFEQAGVPVFVKSLTRASGKVYYSLFLGRFKSYSEAQNQFESFKQLEIARPFKDAFIRTLND